MAFVRVRIYTLRPGTLGAIAQRARAEFLPMIASAEGFRRYLVARLDADRVAVLTAWQARQFAEAAGQRTATWIDQHVCPSLVSVEEHAGENAFVDEVSPERAAVFRLAVDHLEPGTAQEVVEQSRGLVPILRQQPGYVRYGAIPCGDDCAFFPGGWRSRAEAEAGSRAAAAWARATIRPGVVRSVDVYLGDIVIYERAGD